MKTTQLLVVFALCGCSATPVEQPIQIEVPEVLRSPLVDPLHARLWVVGQSAANTISSDPDFLASPLQDYVETFMRLGNPSDLNEAWVLPSCATLDAVRSDPNLPSFGSDGGTSIACGEVLDLHLDQGGTSSLDFTLMPDQSYHAILTYYTVVGGSEDVDLLQTNSSLDNGIFSQEGSASMDLTPDANSITCDGRTGFDDDRDGVRNLDEVIVAGSDPTSGWRDDAAFSQQDGPGGESLLDFAIPAPADGVFVAYTNGPITETYGFTVDGGSPFAFPATGNRSTEPGIVNIYADPNAPTWYGITRDSMQPAIDAYKLHSYPAGSAEPTFTVGLVPSPTNITDPGSYQVVIMDGPFVDHSVTPALAWVILRFGPNGSPDNIIRLAAYNTLTGEVTRSYEFGAYDAVNGDVSQNANCHLGDSHFYPFGRMFNLYDRSFALNGSFYVIVHGSAQNDGDCFGYPLPFSQTEQNLIALEIPSSGDPKVVWAAAKSQLTAINGPDDFTLDRSNGMVFFHDPARPSSFGEELTFDDFQGLTSTITAKALLPAVTTSDDFNDTTWTVVLSNVTIGISAMVGSHLVYAESGGLTTRVMALDAGTTPPLASGPVELFELRGLNEAQALGCSTATQPDPQLIGSAPQVVGNGTTAVVMGPHPDYIEWATDAGNVGWSGQNSGCVVITSGAGGVPEASGFIGNTFPLEIQMQIGDPNAFPKRVGVAVGPNRVHIASAGSLDFNNPGNRSVFHQIYSISLPLP